MSVTPIYDALYAEYRRSFRALPFDRSGEEDLRFVGFGPHPQLGYGQYGGQQGYAGQLGYHVPSGYQSLTTWSKTKRLGSRVARTSCPQSSSRGHPHAQ
ncbi:hypothetical protein AB0G83_35295, partial [Streptomyces klenkii]|uniref:hypothetical protein n=1 Tax=Streptomyces klenkii TaxID=1420899 RepID=UPI0033EB5903